MTTVKQSWFYRGLSLLLALTMLLSVGVVTAFAQENTKSLTNGDVTVETADVNFTATQVSAEVKTAEEGFHDFTSETNVVNYKSYMFGDHGFSAVIDLKDDEGQKVAYTGELRVEYTLPEDWDLSHGVTVAAVSSTDSGIGDGGSLIDTAAMIDNTIEGRTVSFTMKYDSATVANATRVLIVQTAYAADLSSLEDGVYDVGLTMLKDVDDMTLSMAANTLNPDAKLIVQDGKLYLNAHFNKGVVMIFPAFANKVYAIDADTSTTSFPVYGESKPGTVLSYYGEEEVRQFAWDIMYPNYDGMGYDEEEIQELINSTVLQNNVSYINNLVLDITDSLQDNGCYLIGFCSDIMDGLYNGVYGSDKGYNTTNIMISNPVRNTEAAASDLLPKEKDADTAKLNDVFAQYLDTVCHDEFFVKESFDSKIVPAWNQLYRAYTDNGVSQEEVDNALAEAEKALNEVEYGKATSSMLRQLKNNLDKVSKVDSALYTSTSYQAMMDLVPAAQAVYDQGEEALYKDVYEHNQALLKAYRALALKATDYSALEKAIQEMKDVDLSGYTEKTVKAFQDALGAAEAMLAAKDSSDEEIAAQIQALYDARDALAAYDALEDGVYKVNVKMLKINRQDPSMASGAINSTVKLEVIDGEYFATLDFKGITITNMFGYLSKLWYYDEGYTYDQHGEPQGNLVEAEVLTTQKNADGTDVIDQYNDADHLYPDLVKIKLVKTALSDPEGYVPMRVMVPIMESIAEGNGQHNVLMKIDWNSLEKTTEDDPDFQPEEPMEQSPAVDLTDSATGVKIHADKGVFEEGVKLVVTEIASGADYDKAASSLAEVGKKFKLYDVIFLDKDGNEVAPNGTVDISFPVAEGYDSASLAVYRMSDGAKTLVKGSAESGYYTVTTKTAARYAVVEKGSTITDQQNTQEVEGDKTNLPSTGDRLSLVTLLLALAAAGVVGVTVVSRKRRTENS